MLDIKFIKENREIVETAAKNKNRVIDFDRLLTLYEEKKSLRTEVDNINQKRNEAQKDRNIEEGQKLKIDLETAEQKFKDVDKEFLGLMLKVPNISSPDTPVGKDETENQVLRQWGEKRQFSFKPKEHSEIGVELGVIDTETATEVTGPRFAYLKGDLVFLQFAIIQFCLETLTSKEKLYKIAKEANINISVDAFIPVLVPMIVKTAVQNRMARFMKPEDHYIFPEDGTMLIGSAEHTLGPIHMDQVFEEKDLPVRYVGYSTSFRREAGTYGKDTKGILRVHQFDKLEMEVFSLPENGMQEQNFLVAIQEYIMKELNIPYQVMICCTGDMGDPDYRHIDIEAWMPGQDKYRETHSSDNMASYQSRRLSTRVKRKDGKVEYIHMNDATVVALGRIMIAIIENYQTMDGKIEVPKVLLKYMAGKTIIDKLPTL
ncbi:MAG: serine--tRNA ligase [Candidatus Paceibacterota bacterium]